MSDGNFNKALLPPTNYGSGVRAGKTIMRKTAIKAFESFIARAFPLATEEECKSLVINFRTELDKETNQKT